MEKSAHGFKENDWVTALPPALPQLHRLTAIDKIFAHTYCGKIFHLRDIFVVDAASHKKCPRCSALSV